jgi:hypothetical protein
MICRYRFEQLKDDDIIWWPYDYDGEWMSLLPPICNEQDHHSCYYYSGIIFIIIIVPLNL